MSDYAKEQTRKTITVLLFTAFAVMLAIGLMTSRAALKCDESAMEDRFMAVCAADAKLASFCECAWRHHAERYSCDEMRAGQLPLTETAQTSEECK